jgi:lipoyl synthase
MRLKVYQPHPRFPPISLSGTECRLNCLHCSRTYLRGMLPAETDADLLDAFHKLKAEGAIGALLSGGSTLEGGILNLKDRVEIIRKAKAETGLILNLHPGLMDAATAGALSGVIDVASLEIPSPATIREVFRLDATIEAYIETYDRLWAAGIPVVPHVSVYDGDEDRLLACLAPSTGRPTPEAIVVIVFTPTRDTPMGEAPPPTPEAVGGVIARIKKAFPDTEIALGCMRPRGLDRRIALEVAALDAGITRIELPTRRTLAIARERGYEIMQLDACCALPAALEHGARSRKDRTEARY